VIALEKIFYKNLQESARTPKKRKKRQKTSKNAFSSCFWGSSRKVKKTRFWAKKPYGRPSKIWPFLKNARKTGVYRRVQKNVIFRVFLRFLQKNILLSDEELVESWMRVG
jgi:hypothetical protein